jgi:hypothetical protein
MTLGDCRGIAYGFKDKFKYGLSGKWMVDRKIELLAGNRRDVDKLERV